MSVEEAAQRMGIYSVECMDSGVATRVQRFAHGLLIRSSSRHTRLFYTSRSRATSAKRHGGYDIHVASQRMHYNLCGWSKNQKQGT
jgi:hypothetical protein